MDPVTANILKYRDSQGLNNAQLAKLLEVSRSLPGKWETGESNPRRTDFAKFARAIGVTVEQLTRHNTDENLTSERKSTMKVLGSKSDTGIPGGYVRKDVPLIPLYGAFAAAGSRLSVDQTPLSEPAEYIDPGDLLASATGALYVAGDSMMPNYPPGCIVGFRPADKSLIFWGEDYVFEIDGNRRIKRLFKSTTKGWARAVSYNKEYEDVEINIDKIERLFTVIAKYEPKVSIIKS